jgi:hypothetical protein
MATKKSNPRSFARSVTELTASLLSGSEYGREILSPASCVHCGASWVLYRAEDSQFSRTHRCTVRRGQQRYNVRITIEKIGRVKAERDELEYAWRSRYTKPSTNGGPK